MYIKPSRTARSVQAIARAPKSQDSRREILRGEVSSSNDNDENFAENLAGDVPVWARMASGFMAQFIHQEMMQDGLAVDQTADMVKKYEQANQNILPPQSVIKIAV